DAWYGRLSRSGIEFLVPPTVQPWGRRTTFLRIQTGASSPPRLRPALLSSGAPVVRSHPFRTSSAWTPLAGLQRVQPAIPSGIAGCIESGWRNLVLNPIAPRLHRERLCRLAPGDGA